MTIEAHILCFNEEKIVPFAIQYWRKNFTHVYIYDNGSTDESLKIISKEDNVTIYHFDSDNSMNDKIQIYIKNNCWKESKADFVVVCDFDEFIYSANLQEELQYMKDNGMTIAKLNGYEMISEEFPLYDENKLTIETIKNGTLNEMMCKPILFNPNEIKETNFCYGAHFCQPNGNVKWYDGNKIFLLHHKYLSKEYIINKYKTLSNRLSNFNKDRNLCMQYFFDEDKIKKDFDFIKQNSINVYDYANGNIEKRKELICISKISGDLNLIQLQINLGKAYAEKYNMEFVAFSKDEEIINLFNENKNILFNNIRCVDNLYLLQKQHLFRIKHTEDLNEKIPYDIIIDIEKTQIKND